MVKLLRQSKFLPVFLMAFSVQGWGEDYYWKVEESWYPHHLQQKMSSPEEVCRWLLTEYDWQDYRPAVKNGQASWICEIRWFFGQDYVDVEVPIGRYGDSCTAGSEFNSLTGRCEFLAPDNSCPSVLAGNPINFLTGAKIQKESDISSLPNPGGLKGALHFDRYYKSSTGLWVHTFATRIVDDGKNVTVADFEGADVRFELIGGAYAPKTPGAGTLTRNADSWVFYSASNDILSFNGAGKLIGWKSDGSSLKLTRNGDNVRVEDEAGGSLSYTEDDSGQPKELRLEGLTVLYDYNFYKQIKSVSYSWSGAPARQRKYLYEDPRDTRRLTGIEDERGIRYGTWRYDDQGRAISSEHAGGADKISVSYDADGSTTVTNELGKRTKYRTQVIHGIKRIVAIEGEPSLNCPNSNSSFTYDNRGLLKTKTDNKGILTSYDYNDRGLEVSRTEASGTPQTRTITTEWHPSLFLPLVVTEPDRIIRYQYDEQGRQLGRTVETR